MYLTRQRLMIDQQRVSFTEKIDDLNSEVIVPSTKFGAGEL